MADTRSDVDRRAEIDDIVRIGRAAVRKARARSLEAGVPNVYEHNGRLYWESPDGEITTYDPWTGSPQPARRDEGSGES